MKGGEDETIYRLTVLRDHKRVSRSWTSRSKRVLGQYAYSPSRGGRTVVWRLPKRSRLRHTADSGRPAAIYRELSEVRARRRRQWSVCGADTRSRRRSSSKVATLVAQACKHAPYALRSLKRSTFLLSTNVLFERGLLGVSSVDVFSIF